MPREKAPNADANENGGIHLRRPERQKGLWSFLTWSFFLSEVMAGTQFFGSGARAADGDGDGPSHGNGHSDQGYDDVGGNSTAGSLAADDGAATSQTEVQGTQAGNGVSSPGYTGQGGSGATDDHGHAHGGYGEAASSDAPLSGSQSEGSEPGSQGHAEECGTGEGCMPPDPGLPISPGDAAHDTLSQITGLQLIEFVHHATLSDLLGDAVDHTLGQITGLHLGTVTGELGALVGGTLDNTLGLALGAADTLATHIGDCVGAVTGELGALVGGSLDNSLGVALGAADALATHVGAALESLDAPASTITALAIGDVGAGSVSQAVNGALGEMPGLHFINDSGVIGATHAPIGEAIDALIGQSADSGTTDVVAPTLSIVAVHAEQTSLASGGDISSGGTFAFGEPLLSVPQDALFAGGRYTDYSLALHSDNSSAVNVELGGASATDATNSLHLVDTPTDSHSSIPPLDSHDAESSLSHLSSVSDDLAAKGLSI